MVIVIDCLITVLTCWLPDAQKIDPTDYKTLVYC